MHRRHAWLQRHFLENGERHDGRGQLPENVAGKFVTGNKSLVCLRLHFKFQLRDKQVPMGEEGGDGYSQMSTFPVRGTAVPKKNRRYLVKH